MLEEENYSEERLGKSVDRRIAMLSYLKLEENYNVETLNIKGMS